MRFRTKTDSAGDAAPTGDETTVGSGSQPAASGKKAVWKRWWMIVIYVLVGLTIVGALIPSNDKNGQASSGTTVAAAPATTAAAAPATTAAPARATTTADVAASPATTDDSSSVAVDDGDTGRMSDGEFESVQQFSDAFAKENSDMADGMQKCAVLFEALQLADASTCVHDAYSGVNDKGLTYYVTLKDLRGDVAKDCRKQLVKLMTALDLYATTLDSWAKAGENLQAEEFTALTKPVKSRARRFVATQEDFAAACSPT